MKKVPFRNSPYSKDEYFLRFMNKYKLKCKYFLKDVTTCYSSNQKQTKVLIFIMETDYISLIKDKSNLYEQYRVIRADFRKAIGMRRECEFKDTCPGILIYPNRLSSNKTEVLINLNKKTTI